MSNYQLVLPSGKIITESRSRAVTLEEAQAAVEGYVEQVLSGRVQILANEEGLLKQMEYNAKASAIAGRSLVGPVLVLRDKARMV